MLIRSFPAGAFGTNCYAVASGPGQECVAMNWRSLILGLALVLPAAPMTAVPATVDPASLKPAAGDAQAAMWATRFLTRFHYKRVPLDDAMSGEILRRYLESLDGDKLFFTRGDVDGFQHFATSLDEAIYDGELDPPYAIFRTYVERVDQRLLAQARDARGQRRLHAGEVRRHRGRDHQRVDLAGQFERAGGDPDRVAQFRGEFPRGARSPVRRASGNRHDPAAGRRQCAG